MEAKINIAKILKDKPVNTKLYSPLYGDVYFLYIGVRNNIIVLHHRFTLSDFFYNGRYTAYKESEIMLFPSKDMHDWRKFAWKKGDLLINSSGFQCIFKEWASDDYTKFNGCYSNSRDGYEDVSNAETAKFDKLDNNIAYGYVREIERKLGGILNLETLEIEKAQPEFKDGDIVVAEEDNYYDKVIFIAAIKDDIVSKALINVRYEDYDVHYNEYRFGRNRSLRLATDSEKQQLFEALAKENKAWDAEKKMVVNLKPKCEFKPFDKVLCRNSKDDTWEADFFARLTRKEIDYTQSGKYLCVGDLWMYCIPYNEETAHLLGTTDEWKGGEQ